MRDDDPRLKLFLDHRATLVDYATPIVGDRMRAEDVVQEAYIRFAPGAADGAAAGRVAQPVGYLYRIVRNLALDVTRRRRTEDHNRLHHRPDWLAPASWRPKLPPRSITSFIAWSDGVLLTRLTMPPGVFWP